MPQAEALQVAEQVNDIYKAMYKKGSMPFAFVEIRFTPRHERSLISPGNGREAAFINLICNSSGRYEEFYFEVEKYIKTIDARPHVGKYCSSFARTDFERLYGENFTKFKRQIDLHGPQGKVVNGFVQRLFW